MLRRLEGVNKVENLNFNDCIQICFSPSDIHLGDVLFWLPTLVMIRKQGVDQSIDWGEKSILISQEMDHYLNAPYISGEDKTPNSIGFANSLSRQTHNVWFSPFDLDLKDSIAQSIFLLFANHIERLGKPVVSFQDCIEKVKQPGFFNTAPSPELEEMAYGASVVCLDAVARQNLARPKRDKILQSISHQHDHKFLFIGTTPIGTLPENCINAICRFSLPELMSLPRYGAKNFIGFDNFWAHYFSLHNISCEITFRGAYSQKSHQFHLQYCIDAFKDNDDNPL
ncbi:hypothetical protein AB8880_10520 [Alphaproteobacteria bacterium LSUCC0684]